MNIFANVGRATLTVLAHIGRLAQFTARALGAVVSPPIYTRLILSQMMRIGYYSLPVVGLTAFFTGGVLALQIYLGGNRFGAEAIVPQVTVLAITRELGPVIAGLMIAGRVGAAIAAEIGTMKVTEQIDALTTLATNPVKYLVVPRIVAAVISMPILTAIGDSIGDLPQQHVPDRAAADAHRHADQAGRVGRNSVLHGRCRAGGDEHAEADRVRQQHRPAQTGNLRVEEEHRDSRHRRREQVGPATQRGRRVDAQQHIPNDAAAQRRRQTHDDHAEHVQPGPHRGERAGRRERD